MPANVVPQVYREVISAAQLMAIRLVEQSFVLDAGFFAAADPELSYGREVLGHVLEENLASTVFRWSVEAKHGGKTVATCVTKWLVVYGGIEGCEPEAIFEFTQRVGALACYAYFRATVAHTTWSAGINLPPMPMVRGNELPLIKLADLPVQVEGSAVANVKPRRKSKAKATAKVQG